MSENLNEEEAVQEFLNQHKISVKNGSVTTKKELSKVLNLLSEREIQRRRYDRAFYFALNSKKFNSDNPKAGFAEAVSLKSALRKHDTAHREAAEKALKKGNRKQLSIIMSELAESQIKNEEFERASGWAQNSYILDSDNSYALYLQAQAQKNLENYKEAFRLFQIYNKQNPDLAGFLNIGICLYEMSKIEEAQKIFMSILENLSQDEIINESEKAAEVCEYLGNIYYVKGSGRQDSESEINYNLAINYYKNSLKLNKNNPGLLRKLAECYSHFNDDAKELYCYEQALELDPEDDSCLTAVEELRNFGIKAENVIF